VCGECSAQKLQLPNLGNDKVRVCDKCFIELAPGFAPANIYRLLRKNSLKHLDGEDKLKVESRVKKQEQDKEERQKKKTMKVLITLILRLTTLRKKRN